MPRNIALTDVDGAVEVNGHFLFLEWKSGEPREIPTGQRIYAQRLTKLSRKVTYVFICADCETMETTHVAVMRKGILSEWVPCDLPGLKRRVKRWVSRVEGF